MKKLIVFLIFILSFGSAYAQRGKYYAGYGKGQSAHKACGKPSQNARGKKESSTYRPAYRNKSKARRRR